MDQRIQTLDTILHKNETAKRHYNNNNFGHTYKSHATEMMSNKCVVCKGSHKLFMCPKFIEMSVIKRHELIKRQKYCNKCLDNHDIKCVYPYGCKKCNGDHNTLLHFENTRQKKNLCVYGRETKTGYIVAGCQGSKMRQGTIQLGSDLSSLHVGKSLGSINVLLATARVLVKSAFGTVEPLRALIDQGSPTSFITTQAANRLRLKIMRTTAMVSGLGATTSGVVRGQVMVDLEPRFESNFKL